MDSSITARHNRPARQVLFQAPLSDDMDFRAACRELESLGLRITRGPHHGGTPYVVVQPHRADARRWLVPLRRRSATVGSLAMIQPVRRQARVLRRIAIAMGGRVPAALWGNGRVHISGVERAAEAVCMPATQAAFFTGTPGPHRKAVAQLMDSRGGIRGYVKVSCNAGPSALLRNEAATIAYLRTLGIRSAWLPRVRFHDRIGDATVLATDTIKTLRSVCPARFGELHALFLRELELCTAARWSIGGGTLIAAWRADVQGLRDALSPEWCKRFSGAFAYLEAACDSLDSPGFAHGDFTPTNTFVQNGRLGVFDWEYAGGAYPADFDLIRFCACGPALCRIPARQRGGAIARVLRNEFDRTSMQAACRVIAFLCVYALRCALRQPRAADAAMGWAGEHDQAEMLDALLASRQPS